MKLCSDVFWLRPGQLTSAQASVVVTGGEDGGMFEKKSYERVRSIIPEEKEQDFAGWSFSQPKLRDGSKFQ